MSIPDYKLERYRLGELSADEARGLEAQLTQEDRLRIEALEASDAEILKLYPPRVMAIAIRERGVRRRRWVAGGVGALALAGSAVAGVLLVAQIPTDTEEYVGIKAEAQITIKRQAGPDGQVDILGDGARTRQGDLIQLSLHPGTDDFAVAFSIDGRGAVTLHHPRNSATAGAVEPGRPNVLPDAYRLDDAPDYERFFLVTHDEPFGVTDVLDAARELAQNPQTAREGDLEIDGDLHVYDKVLVKVKP